jgi:dTDP-4-dehydrorhamnose reductase
VVKACEATGKKIIYISTDFVFDGENVPAGGYTEEDQPNPVNWYAETKYEGEKRVQNAASPWMIVRIAYPYRANFEKNDFFRAMKNRLAQGQEIKAITDHMYSPTFIDDVAPALDVLISQNKTGIYHVTGSEALSPYDAAMKIAEAFGLDKNLIGTTTRGEYFAGKAERPLDLSMNNAKIKSLGVMMHGFTEGLQEIKKQLESK